MEQVHAIFELASIIFFAALVILEVAAHFAKRRQHLLHVLGFVVFGIAVLCEFIAYPYGRRSDALAAVRNHAVDRAIAEAKLKAANAELAIASANAASNEAVAKVASAEAQIAEANARAAEANRTAEQERLERIKLEGRVAWRRISERQQSEFAAHIAFASRTMHLSRPMVSIWYHTSDVEGASFAADIATALRRTPWTVVAPQAFMALGGGRLGPVRPVTTGVMVASTGDAASIAAAEAVVRALVTLGFDAVRQSQPDPDPKPQVWINVEGRPEGPQGEAKLRMSAEVK